MTESQNCYGQVVGHWGLSGLGMRTGEADLRSDGSVRSGGLGPISPTGFSCERRNGGHLLPDAIGTAGEG